MNEKQIDDLLWLSRRTGERFDLVQSGGGNSSVKTQDGKMYVKASGLRLSDLTKEKGLSLIDNESLKKDFYSTEWAAYDKKGREKKAAEIVGRNCLTPENRPSIETLLHSFLPGFVIHSHPVVIASAFSDSSVSRKSLFPNIAFVPYRTPGIDLALAMLESQENYKKENSKNPEGFILLNHGLVVSGESAEEAFRKTEEIAEKTEKALGIFFNEEKFSGKISEALENFTGETFVTVCTDAVFDEVSLNMKPCFPDGVVFLSAGPLKILKSDDLMKSISEYVKENTVPPKAFYYMEKLYFSAKTYSKAKETEEVWKLHHTASKYSPEQLSEDERFYLTHWEAEKYRQRI